MSQNSFDATSLYNDGADSDICIDLGRGCIWAHRIILRTCPGINDVLSGAASESALTSGVATIAGKTLTFDADDTTTVLLTKYIYGVSGVLSLDIAEWGSLLYIAHRLQYSVLVHDLLSHIPHATYAELVRVNHLLHSTIEHCYSNTYETILRYAIALLAKQYNVNPATAVSDFLGEFDLVDYANIRALWKDANLSHYTLFMLDCAAAHGDIHALRQYVESIDFAAFSPSELDATIDHPALAAQYDIMHLLSCIRTHARVISPAWNTHRRRRGPRKGGRCARAPSP